MKRTAATLLSIWALMLVVAPAALADEGVGLAGPTTDKTVTFFCFGVIAFFAALVIVLSLIQRQAGQAQRTAPQDLARFNYANERLPASSVAPCKARHAPCVLGSRPFRLVRTIDNHR